jgi:hypothetical protein
VPGVNYLLGHFHGLYRKPRENKYCDLIKILYDVWAHVENHGDTEKRHIAQIWEHRRCSRYDV